MSTVNILVVDDEADIRTLIEEILTDEGYRVSTAADAAEAREQLVASQPDLVLLDIWMPDTDGITLLGEWSQRGDIDCPVVIMSGHGTVETAVEATRLGAVDFVEKPLSIAKLLRTVENGLETKHLQPARPIRQEASARAAPVGKSRVMAELRERLEAVAARDVPVLLTGEPGSGREACARSIHARSSRRDQPLVTLSAAAIPADNAAALLLGVETPDGVEAGYLEQADGGTLFVGDLQDLCPEAQRILYGVIDQGEYARVGRTRPTPLNVRMLASVDAAAYADPARAGLRPDLVTTLSAAVVAVPALREHAEDMSELLQHLVDRLVDSNRYPFRRFSVAAQNRLRHYPWPGNVRELANLVEGLLASDESDEVGLEELEAFLPAASAADAPLIERDLLSMPLREAREHFERAYLTEQLSLCGGKVGQLAKRVGMERTHLYRKLRALGVDFRQTSGD
ncbi:MAG: sigma-54-dependent Fis family transcriptional regulator [Gammaproteobacteria bacterium]|nr:sigma-54-dependent Fis family transcriptional regulator [Gammaproteobacteria bacterium]